jgi:beta-galactosidase
MKKSHLRPTTLPRFYYGAAYYPEHWDKAMRINDVEGMHKAAFNCVRMGEFAWSLFEPRPGEFEFSLFDETIQRLGEAAIATILATPTATPPRWLTVLHPEILRINQNGVPLQHGSRQHACTTNPLYREYSRQITRALAEHYQANSNVIGWQTDNELNCEFSECFCPACQQAFQEFLHERYQGDIDRLNQAWGTIFWNQVYQDFKQIPIPRSGSPTFANPSQLLDYYRFVSSAAVRFQHDQVTILRQARPDWLITHNTYRYPQHFPHIDFHGPFSDDLNVLGYDIYPGFLEQDPANAAAVQAFNLDLARSWSGNFFVLEHQSGPAGQSPFLFDTPQPGEMRRMAYTSIARGADSLLFFRWRTARFGAEEYCCGILDHDNVPRRRYFEAERLGQEMAKLGNEILNTSVHVDIGIAAGDFDVEEGDRAISLGLPSPEAMAEKVHCFFYKHGAAVGCVHPLDDLSGLKLYVIPHWPIFDEAWLPDLERYVKKGGMLVIGARSGTHDLNNHVTGVTPPGVLQKLAGVRVDEYGKQNQPLKKPMQIDFSGETVLTEYWYEKLLLEKGVQAVGRWAGGYLEGEPAVICHKLGQGWVFYVGTYLTDSVLEPLFSIIRQHLKVPLFQADTSESVEVILRENKDKRVWFYINHTDKTCQVKMPVKGINLITGKETGSVLTLDKNEVAVVKEDTRS